MIPRVNSRSTHVRLFLWFNRNIVDVLVLFVSVSGVFPSLRKSETDHEEARTHTHTQRLVSQDHKRIQAAVAPLS